MRLSDSTKQLITEAEIRAQDAKFRDTTNSTAVTNGAVVIDGGLGLAKDLQIGGNIVGDTASNLSGFNSITATSFTGDGANLTNTGSTLSEPSTGTQRLVTTSLTTGQMTATSTGPEVTFDYANNHLQLTDGTALSIGTDNDTLIFHQASGSEDGTRIEHQATANDDLRFRLGTNQIVFEKTSGENFMTMTHSTGAVNINHNGNIKISTVSTGVEVTGLMNSDTARVSNITLGLTDGTTINTATGDLKLDSSNNKVHITANAEVDGSMTIDSGTNASSKDTGALVITAGGLGVEGNIYAGGAIHAGGDVFAFSTSDMTLKEDISPIEDALGLINSLSGNTFAWRPEAGIFGNSGMDTGIIAQEVEALNLPGLSKRRGDGTLGVRYDRLIPVLIEAVKELSAKVNSLESNK